jgi:hypothetical protein
LLAAQGLQVPHPNADPKITIQNAKEPARVS